MKLSKLVNGINDIKIYNFRDLEITSVTADSDRCRPGSLFVAICGSRLDGNDFIESAYRRGARVFVSSRKFEASHDGVFIYSEKPRKTLAELCANLNGNPEKKLLFVGITGTKGKTSTLYLLSDMLRGAGVRNVAVGTLGVTGEINAETNNTTPDPTVLFSLFKNAYRRGIRVVLLEVSSQAIKYYRVFGIPFDTVVFTGIGRDHIGEFEHPTFSDYLHSKRALFSGYGAKRAIVNADDHYSAYMASDVPRVVKCGFSLNSDYKISDFKDSPFGATFLLNNVSISSSLPGEYNARNTALALATAKEITGLPISQISKHISASAVPGRFEYFNLCGKNIVIDYAHNKDSMSEIIALSKRLFGKRIICVFGSVGERSYARRSELACITEGAADFSVITSDNPGYEFPLSICADIYAEFKDKTKAKIITDREEAIYYAVNMAEVGDAVLILGKGHEAFMNISGRNIPYSDASVVEKIKRGVS